MKTRQDGKEALEPIVAHGSRMTWAGILRPGDEFPPARRSQLAVLTAESGPPLRRYFGRWSAEHRRFTTNLTSAKIIVRSLRPGQTPEGGIQCILHWVNRKDMVRSDKGGVCHRDGWPVKLWDAFVSELDNLPDGTVAERLRGFLESRLRERTGLVAEWRARVKDGGVIPAGEREGHAIIGESLLPTPARLVTDEGETECIVSWAARGRFYRSLSEALASPGAARQEPDLASQAKYYLECTLARLHGVRFGRDDFMLDEGYERTHDFLHVENSFKKLEQERIAALGKLDRFDPQQNAPDK